MDFSRLKLKSAKKKKRKTTLEQHESSKTDKILKSGKSGHFAKAIETKLSKMACFGIVLKLKNLAKNDSKTTLQLFHVLCSNEMQFTVLA